MSGLSGKVALVTGASNGIGLACAKDLAAKGATVITAQRSTADGFPSIKADFSDTQVPEQVIAEIINQHGQLDILINSAGLMREAPTDQTSLDDWTQTLTVNLTAPFLLIKHAIPHMRKAGGGAIVNIGSIEGLSANPDHSAYAASKAGLHGLTRAVAVDHGKDGIRVNAVAPGWIDTDLNVDFIEAQENPKRFRQEIGKIHPLRKTGTPEEVAKLVSWLAGDEASFVTGQTYTIDGGRTSQLSLP